MFERFPKPSEIAFMLAIITMHTPAVNEVLRSMESGNTIARSCPPLLSENEYHQQKEAIQRQLIVSTTRHASLPSIRYIPPEVQLQLDELEHQVKEARKNRTKIHAQTSGPLQQKDADYIGLGSGVFAFITAGIKELRKIKRI